MNEKRNAYLDNLKWMLIIVVIFHHAGQAYGDGGGWAYTPSNPEEYSPWLWRYFSLNAAFFMGLFFMISAYFIPKSYDKQGFKKFVKKKLLRLGLPILLFCGVFSFVSGKLELAHLWFVFVLLLLSLLYALLRLIFGDKCLISSRRLRVSQLTFLGLLVLGLAVVEYFVRAKFPQDFWVSVWGTNVFEPAHLPQYLLMFFLGLLASRKNLFNELSSGTGVVCCIVATIIAVIMLFNPFGYFSFERVWPWWWAIESLFCISLSFGLVWFFREFFDISNKFFRWLSDQEFGVYIFHLTNMLILQNLFDGLFVGGGVSKMLFIGAVSTLVTFVLTYFLRLIPGVKKVL